MNDPNHRQPIKAWNTYWQGASEAGANVPGGVTHPAFPKFWSTALGEFVVAHPDARILDIATGSGAVIEYLSKIPNAKLDNVSCVDVSRSAIDAVRKRFPDVSGIAADASSIPLESGQYELLTSQFGIEYAGPAAIDEAVRLLAPGGGLLFLMHVTPGVLYREGSAAIDALQRTQHSGFIELALDFFETGFAAVRGADRAPYEAAARRLNPAIAELEAVMTEHGEHVAGDMIIYLYSTVQTIHNRIDRYEPDETLDWLRTMEKELSMHEARMVSMRDCSMDETTFKDVCENLHNQGLVIEHAATLATKGEELPAAWVLQATKPR